MSKTGTATALLGVTTFLIGLTIIELSEEVDRELRVEYYGQAVSLMGVLIFIIGVSIAQDGGA